MATHVTTRPDTRYLGNSDSDNTEVHDLHQETGSCQIDEIIKAGHSVVFGPDTLAQARSEGYDNCDHCLGGSTR